MNSEDNPFPRWFTFAKNISKHSDYRIRMGCILTKGNRPISVGFNKIKYNRLWCNPLRKTLHAEASAIKTSGKRYVKNSTAYIYRETKKGPAMARPCDDCLQRLRKFGVRKIYYSTNLYPFWSMEYI